MSVRNALFNTGIFKEVEFEIPVIGVGNLAVGGTGKTPHISYLIRNFGQNYRITVLSRGYGRRTRGYQIVEVNSTAREMGDEPLMLKQMHPEVNVVVCENRVMGMAELMTDFPDTQLVLLDDAFQHRHIKPGFQIMLSDYQNPYFKDHVLPAGNLREFRSGVRRADLVVFTKCPEKPDVVQYRSHVRQGIGEVSFTKLGYDELQLVQGPEEDPDNVVLVTGIARSQPLVDHLDLKCAIVRHLKFADHYSYNKKDVTEIIRWLGKVAPSVLVTTPKDWVKLEPLMKDLSETTVYIQDIGIVAMDDHILEGVGKYLGAQAKNNDE